MSKVLWSEEDKQTLKEMAARKFSGGQIARKIGKSRSAVAGMAHRTGIRLMSINKGYEQEEYVPYERRAKPEIIVVEEISPPKPLLHFETVKSPPKPEKKPLASNLTYLPDAKPDECRMIIGEVKNLLICGQKTKENSSWCEDHARLIFTEKTTKPVYVYTG